MGIYINTGESTLDAMLTDFAALWKKYRGDICICSDKTITEAKAADAEGYIVLVQKSDWMYSTEGSTFLDAHARSFCLTCPVSYAELEDALQHLFCENPGEFRERNVRDEIREECEVTFALSGNSITVNGCEIHLTPTEYRLFKMFYAHKGEIVPRQVLIHSVWKEEIAGNRCDVHIAGLRRKLIPIFGKGALTCARGAGYVFRG